MKKLRFGIAVAESNIRRLKKPYKVLLALTYRCNERCLTCNIWKRKPASELTLDEIRTFFSKNSHFSWVNLTGGEILLRKDLPAVLDIILSKCGNLCLLNFSTNGLMPGLTERVVSGMPDSARVKKIITVSIDGPPEANDHIRGVKGAFKKSVETYSRLKGLRRSDLRVCMGMTLSRHNARMLKETIECLTREIPAFRYEDLHINVAHTSPHYYFNEGEKNGADNDVVLRDVRAVYEKLPRISFDAVRLLEKQYLRHLITYLSTQKRPKTCQALSSSCFIDPQGTVYPCIGYNQPLGNLRDVDFELERLWCTDRACEVRKGILAGGCPGCWLACEAYQSILGGLLR